MGGSAPGVNRRGLNRWTNVELSGIITAMGNTLATMITMTTYGTWLRGDHRGWVDAGRILPPDPVLEAADLRRMKHPPFLFSKAQLYDVGRLIGESLTARLHLPLLALSVGTWHVHYVAGQTRQPISTLVKCAKEAVRYGLRPDRPIWTAGNDKRFCFDERSVRARVRYVEKHNEALGWPPKPWPFLIDVDEYLTHLFSPGRVARGALRGAARGHDAG
jgi:hypothetical protein